MDLEFFGLYFIVLWFKGILLPRISRSFEHLDWCFDNNLRSISGYKTIISPSASVWKPINLHTFRLANYRAFSFPLQFTDSQFIKEWGGL
jgi:hypothetical protein